MQLRQRPITPNPPKDHTEPRLQMLSSLPPLANKILKHASLALDDDLQTCQQVWAIKGDYLRSRLGELMPFVKQWRVRKLYLWGNKQSTIIKEIGQIGLPNIKELHVSLLLEQLGWNRIESIEPLGQMSLEGLTDLVLRDNQIASIAPLRKCNFQRLMILCLRGNLIRDLHVLSECSFGELKELNLSANLHGDTADVIKINTSQLKTLRARSRRPAIDSSARKPAEMAKKFPRFKTISI